MSRSTVHRRLNGLSQSPRLAHEDEQLLSKKEEESLVGWCEEYTRAGCPVPPSAVRDMAQQILDDRMTPADTDLRLRQPPHPVGIY